MDWDSILGLAIFGTVWHALAIWAFFLLAPFDKKWEGFYLTLFFGPIGFLISLAIRAKEIEERERQG